MNKITRMLMAVSFTAFGTGAYAACTSTYCEGLEYVYTHGGLNKVFIAPGVDLTPLDCTPQGASGTHLTLLPDNPRFQEIYSMLLTAVTTGKRIRVRVRTDDPNTTGINEGSECEVIYAILYKD